MEKSFQTFKIIGVIFRVIGALIGVVTLILLISMGISNLMQASYASPYADYGMAEPSFSTPMLLMGLQGSWLVALIIFVYGSINAVSFYAVGEGIFLLIALEENTRKTAVLLQLATTRPPAEAPRTNTL